MAAVNPVAPFGAASAPSAGDLPLNQALAALTGQYGADALARIANVLAANPGLAQAVSAVGLSPTDYQTLRQQIVDGAVAINPGVTTDLPGTLIEDVASTDAAALQEFQRLVIAVWSGLTPLSANKYYINQLAKLYGKTRGLGANPSVELSISAATAQSGSPKAGLFIPEGTQFTDGFLVYSTTAPRTTLSDGTTSVQAVATTFSTFAPPPHTVNKVMSAFDPSVQVSVDNPLQGTAGIAPEDDDAFRGRLQQAARSWCQGTPDAVRNAVNDVQGVDASKTSIFLASGGIGVCVSGGDDNEVAGAIYASVGDPTRVKPSVNAVVGAAFDQDGNVDITTLLASTVQVGQSVHITAKSSDWAFLDGNWQVMRTSGTNVFTVGGPQVPAQRPSAPYDGNAVLDYNPRQARASVMSGADEYPIDIIRPVAVPLGINISWTPTVLNVFDQENVQAVAGPAIMAYVNGLASGEGVSLIEIADRFQEALSTIAPIKAIRALKIDLLVAGAIAPMLDGNVVYELDDQSYFSCADGSVNVAFA